MFWVNTRRNAGTTNSTPACENLPGQAQTHARPHTHTHTHIHTYTHQEKEGYGNSTKSAHGTEQTILCRLMVRDYSRQVSGRKSKFTNASLRTPFSTALLLDSAACSEMRGCPRMLRS